VIMRRAISAVCALSLVCGSAVAARQTPATSVAPLPLGYAPDSTSDEAGLWMEAEKAERAYQSSPLLVRDPALNDYVKGVLCKVVPDRCQSIRIYVLDIPYFNAAMSPNGAMQVWTGLLLRSKNEAQLAYILGHETSHYTLRHTLALWRRARDTTGALAVFTVATLGLGALAYLAAIGELQAYSRNEEREADAHGSELAAAAGYDPGQNAVTWRELLDEEKARPDRDKGFAFLRTHPETQERLATMQKLGDGKAPPPAGWRIDEDAYVKATNPFRTQWLDENVALGQYEESLVMLSYLLQSSPNSGELKFYQGEVYRRRNAAGDSNAAIDAYHAAIATGSAPPTVYRSLGITEMKAGDKDGAREGFQEYLKVAPAAADRAMVEYYLSHL
jgi:beta-barrel assembly-enhancing protease